MVFGLDTGCQRTIVNVYFSSNSQQVITIKTQAKDVKELLSMFTFQAIHNIDSWDSSEIVDVKELLSMFTFQIAKLQKLSNVAKKKF